MKISRMKNKGMSLFALLMFISTFVQVNITSAIEIQAVYEGDKTKYLLPSGEEITPQYGVDIKIYDIDSVTVIYPALDLLDIQVCFKTGKLYRTSTQHGSKEISFSFKQVNNIKKEEFSFALVSLSFMKKKEKPVVLLTGVGIKPIQHIFHDITSNQPTHTEVMVDKKKYKSNIGAATAYELCKQGFHVHMISRTEDNLKVVQQWVIENFPEAKINYSASSVGDRESIFKIVEMIPKEKTIFWVQSVGLGGGTVKIKDDNPYLAIEDISSELMEAELSVLTDTVKFLQVLLPRFRTQKETKVCIVSSMSAIRSVAYGSIHNAAKGSISRFTNAAMIELNKDKIYVTDVRPGAIDTGMYDSKVVQEAVQKIASSMNYDWSDQNGGLRLAPPSSVGKLIAGILSSEAHITSINMVAKGQFPHEGS